MNAAFEKKKKKKSPIFSSFEPTSIHLPWFPRPSRIHPSDLRRLLCPLMISFCGCRNKCEVSASSKPIWLIRCWKTGCWVPPGNGGELLLQCLIVGELDGLSSAPGFDHVTLKENKCEGQNCPLKEDFF